MQICGKDYLLPVANVGSWPRPTWLRGNVFGTATEPDYPSFQVREQFEDAMRLCIDDQLRLGFDVISDGSQYYESATPADYEKAFTFLPSRIGGTVPYGPPAPLPGLEQFPTIKVVDEVKWIRPIYGPVMEIMAKYTDKPKKVTVASPVLQLFTLHDEHYGDPVALAMAVADVYNAELKDLVARGLVDIVQFYNASITHTAAPFPATEVFNRAVAGVDAEIWDHECMGNAGDRFYVEGSIGFLFPEIYNLKADQVHIALGHALRAPDLELFQKHPLPDGISVGVGVVDVKDPTPEKVDEVVARIERVLEVLDPHRVTLMPDCGWMNRRRDTVWDKNKVLCEAASIVRERYR